ncbi:alpha/beta fold hydrolase [Flavobacterium gawalongense]|uniref:Alpha/beta hydrolase n=1 Tax=Flavobacterium gawalongense TaxID=2594432 RepID=A0A553BFD0_9FLAO|nr:alpha/beta hydrolase [Flavobacterium gawalongense]TRW99846.1 alpha/beta hydrolase [Flavobacterium gawalongense]TRX04316.1 alpha/beta hydrolase [Flavobacterium gawalongense]TRX06964.1 alpha/beta hydrolase [Flavobacterium gawalongense]TRX07906.1 alpha/beta hydrolase [Flavobacterium gawalongense]TRX24154.1 alpha/beta hydrolase [Flavobacterium gawalongense]
MTKKTSIHTQSLKIPKIILLTSKLISFISPKLITLFIAKLFTTPIKHKIPKRELEMDRNSVQKLIKIPAIDKEVVLYQYGKSEKKILLVHGWSGRGTQLFKIADELLKTEYSTVSFDAPAHGKSPGKTSIMSDFIATILEIDKQFGPFEAAVGHSLGGMSVLNAIKKGLKVNHAVVIGSGDIVQDIMDDFVAKLKLKPSISTRLRLYFEKKYKEDMNSYSAYLAAKETTIPVLVIHDNNDPEVPVTAAMHIHKYLKNGELLLTDGLGHRKILGNHKVIEKTVQFIQNK